MEERNESLRSFGQYLAGPSSHLAQKPEFLSYFAMPYVPNLKQHPTYQKLFGVKWRQGLELRLIRFIDFKIPIGERKPTLTRLCQSSVDPNTTGDTALFNQV
ncbi:unnamed protein product [Protopolystoma xenopodis]|uniref:ARMC9 CTLH-like domain-containing protein n=1 Tax=Protopolystoma xenopodis TaxID=117903 RepID=A0A448WFH4_9PLAT|nr:unnamed protein product [Protopolystoma xenopodis]